MFLYLDYAVDKDTRKIVSGLVATLVGTILTCSSKTQRTVVVSITEAEYVALSACAQGVKFTSMFLVEIPKAQKTSVIYEDNQCAFF